MSKHFTCNSCESHNYIRINYLIMISILQVRNCDQKFERGTTCPKATQLVCGKG